MPDRTLEDYGRAAQELPGFTHTGPYARCPDKEGRVYRRNWCRKDSGFGHTQVAGRRLRSHRDSECPIDVDDPGTAGFLETLLGATLVTWDSREDTRGIEVTWGDGDHVYIHCETKGRGLVLAAEYRGRWDAGVS